MRFGATVLTLVLVTALHPVAGGAASPADSLTGAAPDTTLAYLTRVPQLHLQLELGGMSPDAPRLDLRNRLGLRPHLVEMSRYQCSIVGADRGANMALALGTVGSWFGLWDEDTALLMTAAGAAVGGLWGGTVGNASLDFRMRPVWDDRRDPVTSLGPRE